MSVVFSKPTVTLLRHLADQAADLAKGDSTAVGEIFEGLISGTFHDLDRGAYDARVRRTVLFSIQMLAEGIEPHQIVQRLETSCKSHGVSWTMLDIDEATTVENLNEIFELYPAAVANQFIKSGAKPGDKIVSFCSRPYLDYQPENWCSGLALMRENSVVAVVTYLRSSGLSG